MKNGKITSDRTSVNRNSEKTGQVIEKLRTFPSKYGCPLANVTNLSFCGSTKINPLSEVLKQTIAWLVWLVSEYSIMTYPHLYPSLMALFTKSVAKLMHV
jgi:hypothetical protein